MGSMTQALPASRPVDTWVEIRSSRGRLLCRLDVGRLLLEVKPKGGPAELVDLRPLLRNYELGEEEGNNLIDAAGAST